MNHSQKLFKFTDSTVKALPIHDRESASAAAEYSDTEVVGLKVAVSKNGRKTFHFRYTFFGKKTGRKVGNFPALSVAAARKAALEMRAKVDQGTDPAEEFKARKAEQTFAEFVEADYVPWAKQVKRSFRDEVSKLQHHILPKFGRMKLTDIAVQVVEMHHNGMKESHCAATANRHLALLSAIFRQALRWEKVTRNPCAGIRSFKESNGHQRFLSPEEIGRLFDVMGRERNRKAVHAIQLLLLTGLRREEILQARWECVDLEQGTLFMKHTKSGRSRTVVLSNHALSLVKSLESRGRSEWLFPGRDQGRPLSNIRKTLERLLQRAQIDHIRIHDLRHTFASLAVNAGVELFTLQNILGHSTPKMTQRYAHMGDNKIRSGVDTVAGVIVQAIALQKAS